MGEIAAYVNRSRKALPLSVIQMPSGRWGFVGAVPDALAYESSKPDYVRIAKVHGPRSARKAAEREGGTFRSRTWDSRDGAVAAAAEFGAAVA